jgi:hypothetical protein
MQMQHEKKLPQHCKKNTPWQHELQSQHLKSTIATLKKIYYDTMGPRRTPPPPRYPGADPKIVAARLGFCRRPGAPTTDVAREELIAFLRGARSSSSSSATSRGCRPWPLPGVPLATGAGRLWRGGKLRASDGLDPSRAPPHAASRAAPTLTACALSCYPLPSCCPSLPCSCGLA